MKNIDIINGICNYYGKLPSDIAKKLKHRIYTYEDVLNNILNNPNSSVVGLFPDMSEPVISKLLHSCFPGRPRTTGSWHKFLLSVLELSMCISCKEIKSVSEFSLSSKTSNKLQPRCKSCNKEHYNSTKEHHNKLTQAHYIANKEAHNEYCKQYYHNNRDKFKEYNILYFYKRKVATPPWANLDKIKDIYANRPEGYHVDHIIPLNGELVSGLHVENNLQYLKATENLQKSNSYELGSL
jgi:hypothetical protein